ncbi:hypothetical protein HK097_000875 [Rhizophlyctis rosea]|uniref:Uncharacterized protein n=1 Tax=Rhizophlyctis rosea TaxID=64517 RepID=A0AAD5X2B1_9FUNG|nr:hypothetical protein HK097_000875 [Rhizophlyctis rosea]
MTADTFSPPPDRIYPISSSDDAVSIYLNVRDKYLEILSTNQKTCSLTLICYGSSYDSSSPTIYVTCCAPEVLPNMQLCSLPVLVLRGQQWPEKGGVTQEVADPDWYQNVDCGRSIGVADPDKGTGSFGGYLINRSEKCIVGMTCGHVFGGSAKAGTTVDQPSPADFDYAISRAREKIAEYRSSPGLRRLVTMLDEKATMLEQQIDKRQFGVLQHLNVQEVVNDVGVCSTDD